MNGYRLAILVVVVSGALVLGTVGVGANGHAATAPETDDNASSMGEKMGTFMQSSTAKADGSIERGMFEVALNQSENKQAVVQERIDELEGRYERLSEQSAVVDSNSTLAAPARRATMVRMAVELDSLNASIEETRHHARAVGVDTEQLDWLRANASTLGGPQIAEIARTLAGVDPVGGGANPPKDPPGEDTDGTPGTETTEPPTDDADEQN